MPAVFAHDLYGRRIYQALSSEKRRVILAHKDCFYMGLQGPDPLFFYRPVGANTVRLKGKKLHDTPADRFFKEGIQAVSEAWGKEDDRKRKALEAYLMGFACHFALDSCVHDWVNYQNDHSPYTHTALETDLDRRLMVREGYVPLRTERACHLKNTEETREVTAALFHESEETMGECFVLMRLFNRLFVDSFEWTKEILCFLVKFVVDGDQIQGMFMKKKRPEGIGAYTDLLEQMYYDAIPVGVKLVEALWDSMENGKELPDRFARQFG